MSPPPFAPIVMNVSLGHSGIYLGYVVLYVAVDGGVAPVAPTVITVDVLF